MDNQPFIAAYQEINLRLLKLIDSMSALYELSTFDAPGEDETALLESGLHTLLANQDLECGAIYLREDDVLHCVAALDWEALLSAGNVADVPVDTAQTVPVGEGLIGLAASTGEIQRSDTTAPDDTASPVRGVHDAGQSQAGSVLAVPLAGDEEAFGVLCVTHPHSGFFTPAHERSLQIFCNFLGRLISHARLLGRLDERVRQRTLELERTLDDARALKQRYQELSVVDDLTGLHNRRYFYPEARAALARAMRYKKVFSVLLIDVDRFKTVNDAYGHAMGDAVLRDVSKTFKACAREADILARFGGEEFVLVLPATDEVGARVLATRILDAVKALRWPAGGAELAVTVSIGLTVLGEQTASVGDTQAVLERLLHETDMALYLAKEKGRDQYRCHSELV